MPVRATPARKSTRARRNRVSLLLGGVALALLAAVLIRATTNRPRTSLLLVTIDTLRADRLGAYGSTTVRTPNLDALARRGLLFEEALSSVPLTLPSHSTILSGLEPAHHGVHLNGATFPSSHETLATLLKARGYATGAFVGAFILDRRFGLARGFDHYDDRIERVGAHNAEGPGAREYERPCEPVVEAASDWIGRQTGAFLAWVHLYDPHAPYEPPSPFREEYAGRPYDGDVAHADACLSKLFGAHPAAKSSIVTVIVGDHGEALGEHGERTHGFFVYQSTLRVPLIIAGPGVPAGERRAALARTVDLLPTVLGLLDVPVPAKLDGRDLLHASGPVESFAETDYPATLGFASLRAVRRANIKYIEAPRPELYDLSADPSESRDLSAVRPRDASNLQSSVASMRASAVAPAGPSRDSDVAERLRALGYVGTSPSSTASGAQQDPKDGLPLYRLFEEASLAEGAGDWEASLVMLRDLVSRAPNNTTFRRGLASTLGRAGRVEEALKTFAELSARAPSDSLVWLEQSRALAKAGRQDEALRAAERAVSLRPDWPDPANDLGILLAKQGRVEQALGFFRKATDLDPNNGRMWSNRANAHWVLGQRADAREAFRRAAELAPHDPDPLNGLGVMTVEDGDLEGGIALFRKVLALAPDNADARLNLATAEQRRGRPEAARALAEAVLQGRAEPGQVQRAREILQEVGPRS
jgi:arylsulfatase A-like enzyme/Flp pilus assembly protein TadD